MLLKEMFSAIGAPKQEPENIDWLGDLKFFIDNDDRMLTNYFFPAIDKHKQHIGHPDVYKVYLKPINSCIESYCSRFEVTDRDEKFPKEKLIELAKQFASEQEQHLKKGDYSRKKK